ncbi:MAG: hypothetical protein H0X41_07825 [Chitinophagaceae bacterium]|nr:hypothetical protein [Chitinophagaceae bacterium]
MKRYLIFFVFAVLTVSAVAQSADYIVIRKKNNRTMQTYFAGAFISAQAFNGFNVNGYIKDIRHDSIFVQQQDTRLAGTDFGTVIDTAYYTLGFDYHEIERFNISSKYIHGFSPGQKRGGFLPRILPALMTLGGAGYLVLELVNGQYRHESIDAHNKLPSLIIVAGIAASGFTWSRLQKKSRNAPEKYQVIYVHKK